MAPAYAIPRLLARNGLRFTDIALWEIHEAFAAQVLCNVAALQSASFRRDKAGVDADLGNVPWERSTRSGGSGRARPSVSAPPARASCRRR